MRFKDDLYRWKRRYLLRALEETNGHVSRASANIGLHRNTMSRLLREAGITREGVKQYLRNKKLRTRTYNRKAKP